MSEPARSTYVRDVTLVARKELLEIIRDRRSLFVLILLPVVLYPLLFIGTAIAATAQARKMTAKNYSVWVEKMSQAPPDLVKLLETIQASRGLSLKLTLTEAPPGANYDTALAERTVAAVLRGFPLELSGDPEEPETIEILFNGGIDSSRFVQEGIKSAVDDWRLLLVEERLKRESISPRILWPVRATGVDRGAKGALLAGVISALLVMLSLMGAFYPALDLGAGEKERGTLETLLLAPVSRVSIAMGKFMAVFVVALSCALLHLLSMGLTFASFSLLLPPRAAEALGFDLQPWLLPAMLLVLLPLVALFSAISLALATFAASYREGQAYLTPVILMATFPAMIAALPAVELTPVLCVVPVVGASLLMKHLLAETAWVWQVLLVVGSSLVYAGLAIRWVGSLYEREEVLWRPAAATGPNLLGLKADAPRARGGTPTLPQAIFLALLVLLLLVLVGLPLQATHLAIGLTITLVGLVAVPSIAYSRMLRLDWRATFRAYKPKALSLTAAVPLAMGCAVFAFELLRLQKGWTGELTPRETAELTRTLTEQVHALGPFGLLALMALLPAICEEILFRGFVLSGLRRAGGTLGPVLVSALLFAIPHLDPSRLLPTFVVGAVLGALVVRSGSLLPAMLMHFLYNSLVLLADENAAGPWLADVGLLVRDEPQLPMRLIGLACLVVGAVLLWRMKPVGQTEYSEAGVNPAATSSV